MAANPLRLQYHFRDLMKFISVFALVLAVFAWQGIGAVPHGHWFEELLVPVIVGLMVASSVMRPRTSAWPRCVVCGRRCPPIPRVEHSGMCPACRLARLPVDQQQRTRRRSFAILIGLVFALSFVLVWPFSVGWFKERNAGFGPVVVLVATLGVAGLVLGLLILGIALSRVAKMYAMSRPGRALAVARACAGDEGQRQDLETAIVWGFGAPAPLAVLQHERERARERLEAITGRPIATARSVDLLVFAKRTALDAFLARSVFVSGGYHDGMFVPWRRPTIACTLQMPSERIHGIDRVLRMLFAYEWLAASVPARLPSWLQIGIANVVVSGGDPGELSRLNRKMTSALSRGDALDAARLFELPARVLFRLLRNQAAHADYRRYQQFLTQSWSIVEFLCGADAAPERADRFRALLAAVTPREPLKASLERHFGFGYETLLADWQRWVCERGVGDHDETPAASYDALNDRVLPLVCDRTAPLEARIRAVREMGRVGHLLGADVLIELLRAGDPIPSVETVWALESISGLALGADADRWMVWWTSLRDNDKLRTVSAIGAER